VRDFMNGQSSVSGAIRAYVDAVKQRTFPAAEHSF
jgi:3-methyl-2-oxobutanoate hydroxymethyltransferase